MRGDRQQPNTNAQDERERRRRAVASAAKLDRLAREDDGRFLNRAAKFSPDLTCASCERLLGELLDGDPVYKRHLWERDLSVLIGNLLQAHKERRPVAISRNANDWHRPPRYGYPRYHVVKLVDRLRKRGLIGMKKGVNTKAFSRWTRIWPNYAELLEQYPELANGVQIRPPHELVELRDPKTSKPIDYDETEFTHDCRDRLAALNKVNEKAEIVYYDGDAWWEARSFVRAIFIGDFEHYGRLHTSGYRHAQGLKKAERGTARINGKSVVELDFSGLHLRMLYAERGIQYAFGADPYLDVINRMPGMRADRLSPSQQRYLRRYLKNMLLMVLNSRNRRQAESAANYWANVTNRDELEDVKLLGSLRQARRWLERFEVEHRRIEDYFYSAEGLRLMNRDARMALDIVTHFAEQDTPIIPIHDGFIVQAKHEQALLQAMQGAFRRYNHDFQCPISALHTAQNPLLHRTKSHE